MRRDFVIVFALAAGAAALALPVGWTGLAVALWVLALLLATPLLSPLTLPAFGPAPPSPAREEGQYGALLTPLPLRERAGPGAKRWEGQGARAAIAVLSALSGALALHLLLTPGVGAGFWLAVLALAAIVWRALERLSAMRRAALVLAVPVLFGAWIVYLWQLAAVGFAIPSVLLPAPTQIAAMLWDAKSTLGEDFVQTFIRSMIPGYVIGCGAGFITGVLVDRVPFLQRGLLPIGNLASALPIVGIAPIMVMWFGFDWPSKAAVVVLMTFFPMLVNTIAGLAALGRVERDLMRTYAAGYATTLELARLPAALPFLFNALKVNSTLALIGAIVAEFFGTPILGMGFRISAGIGRMDLPLVWATIVVAAVTGSAAYGALALLERSLTFWHPSFRKA